MKIVKSIVKKLIVYLLCLIMLFQSTIYVNAGEMNEVDQLISENSEIEDSQIYIEDSDVEDASFAVDEVNTEDIKEDNLTEAENVKLENEVEDDLVETNSFESNSEVENFDIESESEGDQINILSTEALKEVKDDPMYGRANGYADVDFFGVSALSDNLEYIHNSRFEDYIIHSVIDVSKFQGEIDWKKVKQAGIDYAFIRAGYRRYGDTGLLKTDSYFVQNIEGALDVGIEVGVYFFSQAITEAEAWEEAEYVLGLIEGYDISLPVVIDFEYASDESGLTGRLFNANLSKDTATDICKKFCAEVEENGYSGMVYTNKSILENGLNVSEISEDYKIWLAHYTNCTDYEGNFDFWQYTQSAEIDGISNAVDMSFWYVEPKKNYIEIADGMYTIETSIETGKVIDIPEANISNDINVQIYDSNGTWAQKFYIRLEETDTYVIMSANSGKVLEQKGTGVIQNTYTGTENQQWRFVANKDGSICVESVATGEVFILKGGNTVNGTKILMQKADQSFSQKFYLKSVDGQSTEAGSYLMETSLMTDKMVSLKLDGSSLQISTLKVTDLQKYNLLYTEDGCFTILTADCSKALTAKESTQIAFEEYEVDVLEQKWIFRNLGNDTYTIISVCDGKCLDVSNANTADGTVIQKYVGNGTPAQKFKLYKTNLGIEELEDGIYVIHSALDFGKVLDVSEGSILSDANIQLYAENRTAAQEFVVKQSADGSYCISSNKSGMAVTVKDSKNSDRVNVYQYYPVGGVSQKWSIVPTGKGYYKIVSAIGSKVLDVSDAKTANGTNIQIYTSNNTKAQKFVFEKIGDLDTAETIDNVVDSGTYKISSSLNNSCVLDISDGSIYSGANLQLYTSNNTSAQKFVIQQDKETGLYTITSKKSGMKLVYANGMLKNSTNVYQENIFINKGSRWNLQHITGDYYTFYASDGNFCLDVSGGETANGTNIHIYSANGTKAQIFRLEKLSDDTNTEQNATVQVKEGVYTISSAIKSSMVLDVSDGSTANSANIQLYTSNNTNAQKFVVKKMDNGTYVISGTNSHKLISVKHSGMVDGTNIWQYEDQDSQSQQWEIRYVGNGYYTLVGKQSGKVLDVTGGESVNGTNIQLYTSNNTAAQRFKFQITSTAPVASFVTGEDGEVSLEYTMYAKANETSADSKYYLMQEDCYSGKIYGSPLASMDMYYDVSFQVEGLSRSKLKEIAMDKLVLAVKLSDGTYEAVTDPVSVSNLEELAENTAPIFKGTSKKGLQGIYYATYEGGSDILEARNANTKQTLINLDLASVVTTNPNKAGYKPYIYKGNTYYFSELSDLKVNIRSLNAGYKQYLNGNSETTPVAVTLCLLLSYNSENSFLIDPAARTPGRAYYTLNVREEYARETLEALFFYLGETFGQSDCYVSNWILGNEINSSKAWNYSGSLDFDTYMQCYATAFRMLYTGVKSEKTGNTVSISLDNGWTAVPDTYAGKTTLDTFAKKIHAQNPNIDWSIAYHPYSYPLTRVDFWNDYKNTTDSLSTPYISMRNINVLTNYAGTLESTYGKKAGSIRVLLTEQGYSYSGGAENQAMAIARGYYIAEFNDRIDAFIIRAVVDDADEASGKLYFGLMNSQHEKRIAFYVYEFMDSSRSGFASQSSSIVSDENRSKFEAAKSIVCNTNWSSIVPGFDDSKLAAI